ncbi:helix-turn-helix domain-containing protein [Clostridium hydrogenum]|uniref:helix-turn-helix domain-containing protein n=1 Tax=Clostridium hydrogenum TaxID=2855764 RepID=UPI001F477AFD|nr:XRE family transcriptional regulator [Clostridium hydrogenum]
MSRVGEKIRTIREEANLSQKQFGKKLGVNEGFVKEIEEGRKVINDSLISRIKKVFGKDINDINMIADNEDKDEKPRVLSYEPKKKDTNETWMNALSSILKDVVIYDYYFNKTFGSKQLPVVGGKVEGYNQDKVFFIKIQDNDMLGFRMMENDIAFGHIIHEVENNAICLVEYGGERYVRQVKRLDSSKLLLISNNGNVHTQTANTKEVKVIGKLEKVEFKL